MFTTNESDFTYPIAVVRGGKGNGKVIFVEQYENEEYWIETPPDRIVSIVDNGKLEPILNEKTRIWYIAAPAGSGKSTFVATLIRNLLKIEKVPLLLFSRVKDDPAFQGLPFKVIPMDETLIDDPYEVEEVPDNAVCIFDDVDTVSNKKVLDSIINLQSQIQEIGRHKNIRCIMTSHLVNGNNKKQCRTIMNEMQAFTFFPGSGSIKQIKYCLSEYFGFGNKEIDFICKSQSRWITIYKNYPQIMMSEKKIIFTSELDDLIVSQKSRK